MFWKKYLTKIKPETFSIIFLLILTSFLRLHNLGYSDYIGDEHKAFLIPEDGQTARDFLIQQRKGPMQYLFSYIPRLVIGDFNNELAERIPFALISIASVYVFYLFIKKITSSFSISIFASFLFMVNGFIVGFGRIAQYQNLNLFFSLLSLYYYSDLLFKDKKIIKSTLLGTTFWCFSILSHWDGVFILPVVIWLFIKFLINKDFSPKYKIKTILYNLFLGSALLLPFMIPYIDFHTRNSVSEDYFSRRVGFGYSNNKLYKMFIDLYNPFVTFWLMVFLGLLGILKFKKSGIFTAWFLFSYFIFEIFVRKPGTHIYNFLIPVFVLCGFGFHFLIQKAKKRNFRIILYCLFAFISIFLYFQSYLIFADHRKEYPWEREEFLTFNKGCDIFQNFCERYNIPKMVIRTKGYHYNYQGQKLPLFGFPHSRDWKEINDFVNEKNSLREKPLGYSSNEDGTVTNWYMEASYKSRGTFYFIGVINPVNFVVDPSPPHGSEYELIKTFIKKDGAEIVNIYLINFP